MIWRNRRLSLKIRVYSLSPSLSPSLFLTHTHSHTSTHTHSLSLSITHSRSATGAKPDFCTKHDRGQAQKVSEDARALLRACRRGGAIPSGVAIGCGSGCRPPLSHTHSCPHSHTLTLTHSHTNNERGRAQTQKISKHAPALLLAFRFRGGASRGVPLGGGDRVATGVDQKIDRYRYRSRSR